MSHARAIKATLPALGEYPVFFHRESEEIVSWLGYSELRRLARISHLGVPTAVFEGINHTRREYVLLQCALISLAADLFSNRDGVNLGNDILLSTGYRVSSGEELLKTWVLLSNAGHTQHTYGAENALLQYLRSRPRIKRLILNRVASAPLRSWCKEVVDDYITTDTHFILSAYRVSRELHGNDQRRDRFLSYLEHLLLPSRLLFPTAATARQRIDRLKSLFYWLRLLSIVILDSYNSHHPLRYQLTGTLLQVPNLTSKKREHEKLRALLLETAGWLADELYLHPSGIAVRRHYERRALERLERWDNKGMLSAQSLDKTIKSILRGGITRPYPGQSRSFLRVTLRRNERAILGGADVLTTQNRLEKSLTDKKDTYLAIDDNPFSGERHINLIASNRIKDTKAYGKMCSKVYKWLARVLEADYALHVRGYPEGLREHLYTKEYRSVFLDKRISDYEYLFQDIFIAVVRSLLPENYDLHQGGSEVPRYSYSGFSLRLKYSSDLKNATLREISGGKYDRVTQELKRHLTINPEGFTRERLHELALVQRVLNRLDCDCAIVAIDPINILDQFGRRVDEWDGAVLRIKGEIVELIILEAKSSRAKASRANEAFKQLEETKKIICPRLKCHSRRIRIEGMGAKLVLRIA